SSNIPSLHDALPISDDTVGRVKTYEAIVKGENLPRPGVPESFRVLMKELQSLGLDVSIMDENDVEIELRDTDEDEIPSQPAQSEKATDTAANENVTE